MDETKLGFVEEEVLKVSIILFSLKSECDGRTLEDSTVVLCFDD